MIVTLTANPSVDRTMQLDSPIVRGEVFRATSVGDEAGGKGVNVARAVAHASVPVVAVLPADDDDLLVKGLIAAGVHPVNIPVGRPSRVNITVTEPDGTTTKFNDPGHRLHGRGRRRGRAPADEPIAAERLDGAVRLVAARVRRALVRQAHRRPQDRRSQGRGRHLGRGARCDRSPTPAISPISSSPTPRSSPR